MPALFVGLIFGVSWIVSKIADKKIDSMEPEASSYQPYSGGHSQIVV